MPINVRDYFSFLFNDGKGIKAAQVQSALANAPQSGDDVDTWLAHLDAVKANSGDVPNVGWSRPQSLTGTVSGALTAGQSQAITFSAVGTEASWCSLSTGTIGNPPPANGNLRIASAGVYRFFGEIAYTGNDRTGPTFQAQGTGVIVLGHTNAYSRDADTELIVDRQLDFYVPTDHLEVTISVWNREITASTGDTYGTLTLTASNVDNMYLLPIGAPVVI